MTMLPRAWYNENDRDAAAWLRELIKQKLIAPGDVDERSILDVRPIDLAPYTQCHFFAGIGGWSVALRRAAWPDHRPVWTGSCPCQPFSAAGKRRGFDDERHLWPYWRWLVEQCRPAVVFGEQVANATQWLALVRSDMEALGYAVGAMPIEAASAGADHLRDRYWFVANANNAEWRSTQSEGHVDCGPTPGWNESDGGIAKCSASNLPDTDQLVVQGFSSAGQQPQPQQVERNIAGTLFDDSSLGWGERWTEHEFRRRRITATVASIGDSLVFECPDGKWRRLPPPGVRWLGNGIFARIPLLRGFGNAIDPRPAAAFIEAAKEAIGEPECRCLNRRLDPAPEFSPLDTA